MWGCCQSSLHRRHQLPNEISTGCDSVGAPISRLPQGTHFRQYSKKLSGGSYPEQTRTKYNPPFIHQPQWLQKLIEERTSGIRKHASFAALPWQELMLQCSSPTKATCKDLGFLYKHFKHFYNIMIDLDSWYDYVTSFQFSCTPFSVLQKLPAQRSETFADRVFDLLDPDRTGKVPGEMGGGKLTLLWNFHSFMYFMLKAYGFHWISESMCSSAWGVSGYVNDTSISSINHPLPTVG